jgi:cysteine desulfurase
MYADHAATAFPTLFTGFDSNVHGWANAGGAHTTGKRARAALTEAHRVVCDALHATTHSRLITTSGGTEGTNLVLQGHKWDFIVTIPTEHNATVATAEYLQNHGGVEVIWLPVDGVGVVAPDAIFDAVTRAIAGGRRMGLVSIALVNSEIGTVQNLSRICDLLAPFRPKLAPDGTISSDQSVWVHTDAVQAIGHLPVNVDEMGIDFLTLSAHKFHGPPGVGVLWCRGSRPPSNQKPLLHGGHQQDGWRPGTEPVALIVGMSHAIENATNPDNLHNRLQFFRDATALIWVVLMPFVVSGLVLPTGPALPPLRTPNHISFCIRNVHRDWVIEQLDILGVSASGGSACNTGTGLPSPVLVAVGIPREYIQGSVRLTLSHTNTLQEIATILCPALKSVLDVVSQTEESRQPRIP